MENGRYGQAAVEVVVLLLRLSQGIDRPVARPRVDDVFTLVRPSYQVPGMIQRPTICCWLLLLLSSHQTVLSTSPTSYQQYPPSVLPDYSSTRDTNYVVTDSSETAVKNQKSRKNQGT